MLHLDPGKRFTAVEGPSHFYMQDYIANSNSDAFRCRFVQDWISLKRKLIKSSQSQEDKTREKERSLKRKAALLQASLVERDDEDDDLYNLDESFASSAETSKKPKRRGISLV
jgi:hypothetical protein